jgi:hypothetical protein
MDRNVSNDMTGTSITLPLATIEEDVEEIDNDDESLKYNVTKIIDNNGKRVLSRKFVLVLVYIYV